MTTTRPGVAVKPARARLADRDEYPALGAVATLPPTTGRIMGPTPYVHFSSSAVLASVLPLRAVVSPVSPLLPYNVPTPSEPPRLDVVLDTAPAAVVTVDAAEPVRADAAEWKPVDPQSARDVLRVEREVEIPRGRHHTRRPRPPQLSSGDATERMRRLIRSDKRRRAIMVAASVMIVIVLLGTIWRYTNNGYAADQPATSWNQVVLPETAVGTPAASQAVSASASPSAAPSSNQATPTDAATTADTTAQTTKGPQVPAVLRANAIYGSAIAGSCPEQAQPTTADDARAALTAYVDCMNSVWGPIVDAGRIRFRPASIYFYVNTIVNACTTLHTSDPVTAMYCPMDATIYVSPTGVDSAVGSRFYGAELVTHEYAHHVQSLSQILSVAVKQGWSEEEYSRRVQLQAHCLSFAVLNHVNGFGPDPAIFRVGWKVGPGSATYGSITSLQYWGEKGLAANKVGDCDTFSVPESAVA